MPFNPMYGMWASQILMKLATTKTETIISSGGQVLTGPNAGATYTDYCQ